MVCTIFGDSFANPAITPISTNSHVVALGYQLAEYSKRRDRCFW